MPVATEYYLENRELVELIIKASDIHEGKWYLSATFGFSAGNFGPTDDKVAPGSIVVIDKIGITRYSETLPPQIAVDASVVNPPSS